MRTGLRWDNRRRNQRTRRGSHPRCRRCWSPRPTSSSRSKYPRRRSEIRRFPGAWWRRCGERLRDLVRRWIEWGRWRISEGHEETPLERLRERERFFRSKKKKRDSPKWLVIGLYIDYSIVCFFFQLILFSTLFSWHRFISLILYITRVGPSYGRDIFYLWSKLLFLYDFAVCVLGFYLQEIYMIHY